jgi:radical SAM superfamily enzyme YgiQ (UPF0313 family)
MRILLYSPDDGVSRAFVPHLWMFLLQSLTPSNHEVLLLDGNARAMSDEQLVRFARSQGIGLVGIGAMTRMIAKAYRAADCLRAAGIPVVIGGPHVTEVPDEALGLEDGCRHADAVAAGEADETWPIIVEDAAGGRLKDLYQQKSGGPDNGKPDLQSYPDIPWDTLDLDQFNLIPHFMRPLMGRMGSGWRKFYLIPLETGRGCPYCCEFCTVTGFFGGSLRFRTNESVVNELLRLKARVRRERGQVGVFFVDDNLAINVKRTKSLLRDVISAKVEIPWVGQISANLLRDEELIDLIAESGGKWIFVGMESVDPVNLADVNKGFSRPNEYSEVLERLARRNIFAITSFIFGMDNDTPGVAERTLAEIKSWPPGLPVFGQLTPYPGTPLYNRLEKGGRLARPRHWMDFAPFEMAHRPLKMTVPEVRREIDRAWSSSYSPERNTQAIDSISDKHVGYRIYHLAARLLFRNIYFAEAGKWSWVKTVVQNRRVICDVVRAALATWGIRWAFRRKAPVKDVPRARADRSTEMAPKLRSSGRDAAGLVGVVAEGRPRNPDLPRRP